MKFGSVCVGETIKKSFVIHNNGALSTCFAVNPVSSLEKTVTTCITQYYILAFKLHHSCSSMLLYVVHVYGRKKIKGFVQC